MKNNKFITSIVVIILGALLVLFISNFSRQKTIVVKPPVNTPANTTEGWKVKNGDNFSFKYPENFSTKYLHPQDWPPQVQILNEQFNCTEGGKEIARAGQTTKEQINNQTYCVTKVVQGAAGSTYTQYAYAFAKNNKTVILNFTIRAVQCANYDDPQKTECESERQNFDINSIIDKVAKTLEFK